MSPLHHLIYYSRNTMTGSEPDVVAGIEQILASSRRNNVGVEVTGALMFNRGCFAQILEGPRAAIEQTFERIQRDDRHAAVVVLAYAPIAKRAFPNWSMAFVGANDVDRERFGSLASATGFDPAHVTAEMVTSTLHRLVGEEEATAG
jgi:hypothetical protein